MKTITLKKEYWIDFVELLEEVYEKDNPYKYILAQMIRDAVNEKPYEDTADVTLDDNDCRDAVEIAADIQDYYYAISPRAVRVVSELGFKVNKQKISMRKKHLNVITLYLNNAETNILQSICKDCMIKYDAKSFAHEAASTIDCILDTVDIGEDCVIDTHVLYLDPIIYVIDDKLNNNNTPRKKRLILDRIRTRLSSISIRRTIVARDAVTLQHMSDDEKIRLAKTDMDDFEAQKP
ncbi:hypothetical protein Cpap_0437 [Ruminiclostridium papyrosolvens DSM 2782]|uniref:Uncharacterized protein n=1 Tax=Ruminiclostridium papyrosolvens DSM 2782 TaxID=588581 RepID=F1THE0_9FIRM|nr:hypothetical protein [Ruminiclostridium papyrosolvens]EGD46143.1 hypothetical protein Cpap_0437 [Ruminiclostridium papyrosolvens DSM 2782]WES35928.1 hypothetical protein P0092_08185 [Ruminiclostridium papyrosolvens DSM 2782]